MTTQLDVLTVPEVAERLRLSRTTVYRMLRRGELPMVRLGRSWRVDGRRLDDLFAQPSNPVRA